MGGMRELLIVVLLVFATACEKRPSPEEIAAAEALYAARQAKAQATFDEGLALIGQVQGRLDAVARAWPTQDVLAAAPQRCDGGEPTVLVEWQDVEAYRAPTPAAAAEPRGLPRASPLALSEAQSLQWRVKAEGPRARDAATFRAQITPRLDSASPRLRAIALAPRIAVMRADELQLPRGGDVVFQGGRFVGQIVVFDSQAAVLCRGPVSGSSSERVVAGELGAPLTNDLFRSVRDAARTQLEVIAPGTTYVGEFPRGTM